MNDKRFDISAWWGATVLAWGACLTLMVIGTVAHVHALLSWGLVAAAFAATLTVGCFVTKQTKALNNTLLLSRDAREQGLTPLQRRR